MEVAWTRVVVAEVYISTLYVHKVLCTYVHKYSLCALMVKPTSVQMDCIQGT